MAKNILNDINTFYKSLASKMDKIVLEDDLQEALAKYLAEKSYKVLREVSVTNDDAPVTKELEKEHVEIDVVAYAEGAFYPIELKLYNKQYGGASFTAEQFDYDRKKIHFYSKHFDVAVSRARALTDDSTLRESIAPEDKWHKIGKDDYKWYGTYVDGSGRKSFKDIWNRNVEKKQNGDHDVYKGETVVFLS